MEQTPQQDKHRRPGQEKTIENPAPVENNTNDEDAIESVPLYRNFKLVIPGFLGTHRTCDRCILLVYGHARICLDRRCVH